MPNKPADERSRQAIAYALFALLLDQGPLDCSAQQLADMLRVKHYQLRHALDWLREEDNVAKHGWTIPYQQPGGRSHRDWRIVDNADHLDDDEEIATGASFAMRRGQMTSWIGNTKTQCTLVLSAVDGRSATAKHLRNAMRMLDGALACIEESA